MSVVKQQLIMEDMISRFPHIGEQIFRKLSNASLAKCRVVDRDWQNFIHYQKFYQIKIQKLMLKYKKWYCSEKKITPLHLAAATGQTQIVIDIIKEEGTIDHYFQLDEEKQLRSPLHYAVGWMGYRERKGGYLSVCRVLINNIKDKNPKDYSNCTPFQLAVVHGSFEVCKFLFEQMPDKNPDKEWGLTPLHRAAIHGRFPVFKMIFEAVDDKNPGCRSGFPDPITGIRDPEMTPLHFAARGGHLEICKLIVENVQDKGTRLLNLAFERWPTPIQFARIYERTTVVKYLQGKVKGTILNGVPSSMIPKNKRGDKSKNIPANKRRRRY